MNEADPECVDKRPLRLMQLKLDENLEKKVIRKPRDEDLRY